MKSLWADLKNTLHWGSQGWKRDIASKFYTVGGVNCIKYPDIDFLSMKSDTVLLSHFHPCCVPVTHCVTTIRCHHSTAVDFWGVKQKLSSNMTDAVFLSKRFLYSYKRIFLANEQSYCSRQQEWHWLRLSRSWKSLALFEVFDFRLLILRFNFCVGSASTLQIKAPTWPSQSLACLARDSFGWNELGLSLWRCTCTWCTWLHITCACPTGQEAVCGFTAATVAMGLSWLIVFHEENRAGNVFFPLCLTPSPWEEIVPKGIERWCNTAPGTYKCMSVCTSAWQNRLWKCQNYLLTGHNYRDSQQTFPTFSWS